MKKASVHNVIKRGHNGDVPDGRQVWIYCPGCKTHHVFKIDTPQSNGDIWNWNGSEESPTFTPSMLVYQNEPELRCHSFVTNGKIQFLTDSFHELKGQTVELPEIDI